jgi:transposase
VIYQKIITAYADSNRRRDKTTMTRLIASIRRGVPTGLEEIAQLGRTLWRRRDDILASSTTTHPTDLPKRSTDD